MIELPEWKKRALQNPKLKQKQIDILKNGPKSLTDAWFLQAMKYKYDQSKDWPLCPRNRPILPYTKDINKQSNGNLHWIHHFFAP